MKKYDVVIIGGSIAGSVFGEKIAKQGFKTLMVEAAKTPREKACSGIQFPYFEKIIGKKIPRNKLCQNQLTRLYLEYPNGKARKIPFKMLNFERLIFDDWLNQKAIEAGIIFRDGIRCIGFEGTKNGEYIVNLHPKHSEIEQVKTQFLVAADGLNSTIRKKIRPEDFSNKPFAPTMNYYIKATDEGDLIDNTLYQFWNLNFSNMMFAWTYKKNDIWVVGTGHSKNFIRRCDLLLKYVKNKFGLKGKIIKKEGFASTFQLNKPEHVFLGKDNIIFLGDAAGLVDMYRGLGMDAAALSGRKAAESFIIAKRKNKSVLSLYKKSMTKIVKKIDKNVGRQLHTLESNDELLKYLQTDFAKSGIKTLFASIINKILPPNKKILLPL